MRRDLACLLTALLCISASLSSQDLETDHRRTPVVRVVEQAKPAVVSITTNKLVRVNYGFIRRTEERPGEGTGVVIFDDGYVMTNYHVVKDATKITVRFDEVDDARSYVAEMVSRVEEEDLALLKIQGGETFPTIPMSTADPILGETVVAIGNAYGNSHTVSTGIISGLRRDVRAGNLNFTDLLQTDAAINPGNSGGPLLNIDGELIGINTAVTGAAENIGFAIPVARVRSVLYKKLLSLDRARAWLGFEADQQFRINTIFAGGPGHAAGLQIGDRIVNINDSHIDSQKSYNLARLSIQPLDPVTLSVERQGKQYNAQMQALNWLDGVTYERLGLIVVMTHIGPSYSPYLKVTAVDPQGPAATVGIQPDDVIAAMKPDHTRAKRLRTIEDLLLLLARTGSGGHLEIEIWRDDDKDGAFEHTELYSEVYTGQLDLR